jgi:hypothetical protein
MEYLPQLSCIARLIRHAFLACILCIGAPVLAASGGTWCSKNPAQTLQGRSVQLSEDRLHVVLASKQSDAKQRLSMDPLVSIDKFEATQLVGNAAALSAGIYYYLVRASADDLDGQYTIASRMSAYVFPERRALQIINAGLSAPDASPRNFALVIETDAEIDEAEIICLTAS